jgi:hypothetical protein
MKNTNLKQTIKSIIGVALGSIIFGVLSGKYILGICFCSGIAILSNIFFVDKGY